MKKTLLKNIALISLAFLSASAFAKPNPKAAFSFAFASIKMRSPVVRVRA